MHRSLIPGDASESKRKNMGENRTISSVDWAHLIDREDWEQYVPVLDRAAEEGLLVALAGGLAFSEYSGRLRNTKDVDIVVESQKRERLIQIVTEEGWADYYEKEQYDRSWIYRSHKDNLILDIIWGLPNHRFDVDKEWVTRGGEIEIYGRWTRLISLEHLIVAKLYVFQRDRTDWPDLFNVLNYSGAKVDWNYLLKLVGRDALLLGSLLAGFKWLAPDKAKSVPEFVWERVGLKNETGGKALPDESRAFLLDTRDWFGPNAGRE